VAETGSGKTLVFVLPALVHIKAQPNITKNNNGPVVLVLSPTRELAMQTTDVCIAVGTKLELKSVCVYGGVDKNEQRKAILAGVHIVVATPGRLMDFLNEGCITLQRVTYLVLDEADRMLDMGFEKDIRFIAGQIRKDRQTLMFSATWPQAIQDLAAEYFSDPVQVNVGTPALTINLRVSQIVEVIDYQIKEKRLIELLHKYHSTRRNRILIFVLYKKEAPRIENMIRGRGWKVNAIHGDNSQDRRTAALEAFKSGEVPLLVATDVAARGLDIPDVEYVINFTFPLTIEDYIHRIGRTGRGGKTGISHTLFTIGEKSHSGELINVLQEANQNVPTELLKFGTAVKKRSINYMVLILEKKILQNL